MDPGVGGAERPSPVIRVAPLGELKAYTVHEHELDALARGSSGSLFLNFAPFFLPISLTLLLSLLTTDIQSNRLFDGFVSGTIITAIAGMILMILWWREHRNARALIAEIKNRMPPPQAIQQVTQNVLKLTEEVRVDKRDS